MRTQILPLEIAQFVEGGEIRSRVTRAALEADDLHARFGELRGEYSTRRADADDDDIRFLGRHGLRLRVAGL
jgi:hypothetical protein